MTPPITATITANTVFKHGTTRSSVDLPPEKKLSVPEGTVLNVLAFRDAGAQHQIVTFDRNLGRQHKNTWYVFDRHIRIDAPQSNGDRRISGAGIDLVKFFEGLKLQSYKCPGDVWTVGIGHTKTARPWQTITKEQAIALFRQDIQVYERGVEKLLEVDTTQAQFDALVSFAFNLGLGALRSSTLLKRHNRKQFDVAANEFGRWVYADGERLQGLVRRRAAESELYLK